RARNAPALQVEVTEASKPPVSVTIRRADSPPTADQALWTVIRNSANALSFNNYARFMDVVLCGAEDTVTGLTPLQARAMRDPIKHRLRLPFPDTDAYRQLKVATEVFVMLNCGIYFDPVRLRALDGNLGDFAAESRRHYQVLQPGGIENLWNQL